MHYSIFQCSNLSYVWHSCCSFSVDGIVDDRRPISHVMKQRYASSATAGYFPGAGELIRRT
jgi:hypothetical protein